MFWNPVESTSVSTITWKGRKALTLFFECYLTTMLTAMIMKCDRCMNEYGALRGQNQSTQRKTYASATLPNTNPILTALGLNLGLQCDSSTTSCLIQGMPGTCQLDPTETAALTLCVTCVSSTTSTYALFSIGNNRKYTIKIMEIPMET